MRVSDYSAKERVLIVEVNWLGDVLFSTPAIRAIRKKHPGAYVAALVVPRCRALLMGNNYLDEVIVLDEEGKHKGFRGALKLIRMLASRRFDVAYILRPSLTRTLYLFFAGVRKRIGFVTPKKKTRFFLTESVVMPGRDFHRADVYHYLVTKSKIPEGERYYDFFVSGEDRKFVSDLLIRNGFDEGAKFVVLHVGGNWDLKLWPRDRWAQLIDDLGTRYGMKVIISGSFMDHPLAQDILHQAHHKPFIATGLTTLKQLGVLFQRSDLVISADSGPLHIATAMEARTIALFGPTAPEITGPLGRGEFSILRGAASACHIPCYKLDCKDNVCMKSITVAQVLNEAEKQGWLKRAL